MDPDGVWCISISERSFLKHGICISKPALEMTLYITTRAMILWVGLGCTEMDRNGLPEFQNFMGLIHESLVEDILHSCHFWRSQTFCLCVWRDMGWFWSLFFCQVMFYQWLVLPPLWPQRFRGDISPVFFQKRSHDFKDHFFSHVDASTACWFHAAKLVDNWTFLPFLVKLKAGKHLFGAYVSWMILK